MGRKFCKHRGGLFLRVHAEDDFCKKNSFVQQHLFVVARKSNVVVVKRDDDDEEENLMMMRFFQDEREKRDLVPVSD